MEEIITMRHGSGGAATSDLIRQVFADACKNDILDAMEDAAVVPLSGMTGDPGTAETGNGERLAVTTDSFVVTPVEYRGGDIGRLAVCGTVNDLLMRGAVPKYLTAGWILEVGAPIELLRRVAVILRKKSLKKP